MLNSQTQGTTEEDKMAYYDMIGKVPLYTMKGNAMLSRHC